MDLEVVALRRYPVKSMGGEPLSTVALDERGVVGDRWYAVEDEEGRFASGKSTRRFRRRDEVFAYAASTTHSGDVVVSRGPARWEVGDPALDDELSQAMDAAVRVTPETAVSHQDMGAVSLVGTATLDWCADRWGVVPDSRRLRVNIVFASDEPFVEERWMGSRVSIGDATLRVVERIPRCRMIDIDQDGARVDGELLRPLAQERDLLLGAYADVITTGVVSVGDTVVAN